jgi:acyl carrier protein
MWMIEREAIEAGVARIMAEVLGIERLARDDEFLLAGGDSVQANRVAARLREEFDVWLSPSSILWGSVGHIAAEIEANLRNAI